MSYSTSSPPQLWIKGISASTGSTSIANIPPNMWFYRSADSTATVFGAGYFTDAQGLGMKQGDLITVQVQSTAGSTGILGVIGTVTTVTSTGATLGAATVIGSTS